MDSWRFDAIGTVWEIGTERPLAAGERAVVTAAIDGFDRTWSRFREDSLVSALFRQPQEIPVPYDAPVMLDLYRELSAATAGAVQPLVGESLAVRGYDAGYSLHDRGAHPAPVAWTELLTWDAAALELHDPALIDVGALGKGRLVDIVHDALGAIGHAARLVDAGGDLRLSGAPIRVGLEHPFDTTRAIGVATLGDAALCGSAVNRRAWPGADGTGLHHVLDARTGEPVRTWAATWAIAEVAMLADAAATALFFEGGAEFADRHGVEWLRMSTDGRVQRSAGSDRMEVFA